MLTTMPDIIAILLHPWSRCYQKKKAFHVMLTAYILLLFKVVLFFFTRGENSIDNTDFTLQILWSEKGYVK